MQDLETLYDSPLLEHRNRRAIVRLLTEKPGMNRNQLQEAMHASLGVVDFHLRKLVHAGIVIRKPSANDKEILLFTRRNCHLWTNPNTRVLFGAEFTRNVALAVLEAPGATSQEIASALGIEPVTVRYHLNKLKENSLVGDIRVGNQVEYHPTRELQTWNDRIGYVYDRPWEKDPEADEVEEDHKVLPLHAPNS